MLAKLNKIKNWQAAIVLTVVGSFVYLDGLTNPFQGDDITQIVNNIPVHSITNVRLFFEGGTFYNGQGLAPPIGVYYRPLMTTVFSALYTLFGAHSFYFHLFQLMLCIGSSIILYLFFRFSFKPVMSLVLALIFLVHPIDSQVEFYIPNMQDALYFFFGILALYILFRFKSISSLSVVAFCLFLSLLAKETGILFVVMAVIYLFWYNRKRLYWFIGTMVLPLLVWFLLRLHAIGLNNNPHSGPIDNLSLAGRLFTAPSILLFYISKLLFPVRLASGYYWAYPKFSINRFLLPLVVDVVFIALVIYVALLIKRKATKAKFHTFLFFAIWSALGIVIILQITPLDMTASETWFYFSMAGVLGMLGVAISTLARSSPIHLDKRLVMTLVLIMLVLLCLRTAFRGTEYRSQYILAQHDISASSDDYIAYNDAAQVLINDGQYEKAKTYVDRSLSIYPTSSNYLNLGAILTYQGNYSGGVKAFNSGLKSGKTAFIYQNLGRLTLLYGNPNTNKQFLINALSLYPKDYILWACLALLEDKEGDNADAKVSISNARLYGQIPQSIYEPIMNNQPFIFNDAGKNIVI